MKNIRVVRTLHIEQSNVLEEAMVLSVGYVSVAEDILMETVGFGGQREYYFRSRHIADSGYICPPTLLRQSVDNGRNWTTVGEWPQYRPLEGGRRLQIGEPNFTVHSGTGARVRFYRTNEDIDGLVAWDPQSPVASTGKIWYEESADGRSWSKPRQVIIGGGEFDEIHWAPDVWYGKNSGFIEGSNPVDHPDGRFLLPFDAWDINDPRHRKSKIAGPIGRWKKEGGIDWSLTSYTTVKPECSNCGGQEPSIVALPDGRLIMSIRVRVDPNDGTKIPSGKFYTVSGDMGNTWSEPEPFRYDNGNQVFCPACLAHLFFSSKNGRLYLITNFLDQPTHGCDPRTSLQIAEVDLKSFLILRDTLTVIETRRADQLETIRFSNWRDYEDRATKNMILFMTGCPGNQGRHEQCRVPPHSYRYEIELPG